MDNLIPLYKKCLNLEGCTFKQVEHEDGLVAIVYKVILPDGTSQILKICDRSQDYFREIYFLKHFNSSLPVARIINSIESDEAIHGAILMQCFPGELLKATDITEKLSYKLGSVLAQIHLNRTTMYGDLTDLNTLNIDPAVHFTSKFQEGLMECAGNLPPELLHQCHAYYNKRVHLLKAVDGPCIIHRDFRPGNIMVNEGNLQGIIDWASGRAGFAEDDFCPMELGEWGANPVNKNAFLMGYASIRPVPNYAAIMPFLRLSRAIATIGFTVKRGTWDNSSSLLYKTNRAFLDIFFNSNEGITAYEQTST